MEKLRDGPADGLADGGGVESSADGSKAGGSSGKSDGASAGQRQSVDRRVRSRWFGVGHVRIGSVGGGAGVLRWVRLGGGGGRRAGRIVRRDGIGTSEWQRPLQRAGPCSG